MHTYHLLLMFLLLVFVYPVGLTAQTPTPDEADIVDEEPLAEEGGPLADAVMPEDAGTVSAVCGTASGTRFNLESRVNASPQHTQSVDLLRTPTRGDLVVGGSTDLRGIATGDRRLTGYFVSRDADCGPEFEGRLPDIAGMHGGGRPVVVADPARQAVFMADLRYDNTGAVVGLGLVQTTAATLRNAIACPAGTHTAAQAATCWPTRRFIPESALDIPEMGPSGLVEFHLAVDERTNGTGAGNVYLASIMDSGDVTLVACTNTLTTCSPAVVLGGGTFELLRPHVAVRPDGRITVTWVSFEPAFLPYAAGSEIDYNFCTPARPPTAPTCGVPRLVAIISDRIIAAPSIPLLAHQLPVTTHPKHDHRQDANGIETYVVWEQCKVSVVLPLDPFAPPYPACPDADVMMTASRDDGVTWSAPTCLHCGAEDQFLPVIKTDRSRNIINIAFYGFGSDPTFQRRSRLFLAHIVPGPATPDRVTDFHQLTSLLNDLEAGPHPTQWTNHLPGPPSQELRRSASALGYIGLAARGTGADGGSRAYVHFTYNNIQGLYSGIPVPELNNHLGRLDY